MIAYRFQNLADHPFHGVVIQDNKPRPALFLTPEKAKETAPDYIESTRLTIARIQAVVSDYYGLTSDHMRGPSKTRDHVYPRQMAMLLSRELTKSSLPDIGRRFGGRDHSTVIYGIDHARLRIETDLKTRTAYRALCAMFAA